MTDQPQNGTRASIDGRECVYYDGYWIRWYQPPEDSLAARKDLIVQLTRRAFHHTEAGINTPGEKLEEARAAYEQQTDPARKRVNAAMLAGALFHRATDIFTTVVELAEKGVEISPSNGLLRQCGGCFKEALKLGRQVRHYSGDEGIDELWGEPLKAFTMPIAAFYESRYVKIAQSMQEIDRIALTMTNLFGHDEERDGFAELALTYARTAKLEVETMKSDPAIFNVWPDFVVAGEELAAFVPKRSKSRRTLREDQRQADGYRLIIAGKNLITYIAGARVPMPRSTREYLEACERFVDNSPPRLINPPLRTA